MVRFIFIFIVFAVFSSLAVAVLGLDFSRVNYWQQHGFLLLVFLALFPRCALVFSSIPFGGILWWLGFILCPRYLIALLATHAYWYENPILVCFAWFFALGGESSEKYYIRKRYKYQKADNVIDVQSRPIN